MEHVARSASMIHNNKSLHWQMWKKKNLMQFPCHFKYVKYHSIVRWCITWFILIHSQCINEEAKYAIGMHLYSECSCSCSAKVFFLVSFGSRKNMNTRHKSSSRNEQKMKNIPRILNVMFLPKSLVQFAWAWKYNFWRQAKFILIDILWASYEELEEAIYEIG